MTYRSPKTEVKPSPIHGRGLFARDPIAALEIVAVKGGHVLTRAEWTAIEPVLGAAEVQIAEDLFAVLAPRSLEVTTVYNIRGGFLTTCAVRLPKPDRR